MEWKYEVSDKGNTEVLLYRTVIEVLSYILPAAPLSCLLVFRTVDVRFKCVSSC